MAVGSCDAAKCPDINRYGSEMRLAWHTMSHPEESLSPAEIVFPSLLHTLQPKPSLSTVGIESYTGDLPVAAICTQYYTVS